MAASGSSVLERNWGQVPFIEGDNPRADLMRRCAGQSVEQLRCERCALVDIEGLPFRVVVHAAAIQNRDGAALVFDRIRQRFKWLELIWADGGYNTREVEHAVAQSRRRRRASSRAISFLSAGTASPRSGRGSFGSVPAWTDVGFGRLSSADAAVSMTARAFSAHIASYPAAAR